MKYDPILTEVHRAKDALAFKYGYDPKKLVKALQRSQKKSGAKVVSFAKPKTKRAVRRVHVANHAGLTSAANSTRR